MTLETIPLRLEQQSVAAMKLLGGIYIIFAFVGCTQTTVIDKSSLSSYLPESRIQKLSGRLSGEIKFADTIVFPATNISVLSHFVSWKQEDDTTRFATTLSLEEVAFRDHTRGAIEGAVLGLFVGAGLGASGVAILTRGENAPSRAWGYAIFITIGGLLGAVTGGIIGDNLGEKFVYLTRDTPDSLNNRIDR